MVIRKASLASCLAWRVSLIHSLPESSSLMYHFQSCTSQIQPWDFFEVSQSTLPTHTHSWFLFILACQWRVLGWARSLRLFPGPAMMVCLLLSVHTCADDRCASSTPSGDNNSLDVNFLYLLGSASVLASAKVTIVVITSVIIHSIDR